MKAIQFTEKGGIPIMLDIPEPMELVGFQKLRVSYAALNHRDVWILKGQYAGLKYPIVPGSDACGYVDGNRFIVNPGFYWGENQKTQSRTFQILGLPQDGSFAEWVNVPVENLVNAPGHLDDVESAALGLAGVTAFRALVTRCQAQSGERLLITGIGGGVALFILQIAVHLGLEVYVTSSDSNKLERARSMGAVGGVLYTDENWDQVLGEMNPNGFDLIVDGYAGHSVNKLVKVINPGGRICFYGGTGGKIHELIPQQIFWKQISILGSTMGSPLDFQNFMECVHAAKLVPVIDSVYEMADIQQAFQRMEDKAQFGKIVIKVKA